MFCTKVSKHSAMGSGQSILSCILGLLCLVQQNNLSEDIGEARVT